MMELIEQMKAEGHTHIGLLPDDWATKTVDFEEVRERTAEVVMAIDPGSDSMAIRRFLIDQRGIRGDKSPIFVLDDAPFIRFEHSKGEMERRMAVVMEDLRFKMPEEAFDVLAEEDAEPDSTKNKGPRKRSKYQRGNWWNK